MVTANDAANGTTFNFGGVVGKVNSISYDRDSNAIDTTSLADTTHVMLPGIVSVECTIEAVGTSTLNETTTPTSLTITYPDATTDTIATARIIRKSVTANLDSPITTSITFAPNDEV